MTRSTARQAAQERGLVRALPGGKTLLVVLGIASAIGLVGTVYKMNKRTTTPSCPKKLRAR